MANLFMAFYHALRNKISQSITVNYSSSKKEAAPTHSAGVTAGVISGDQDAVGADQNQ